MLADSLRVDVERSLTQVGQCSHPKGDGAADADRREGQPVPAALGRSHEHPPPVVRQAQGMPLS